MRKELRYWLISLLLFTPVIIFYVCHFNANKFNPELIPTGFIQYDMPYYMANAREYLDQSKINLFYPLPFSDNEETPAVYFQPHILLLGIIYALTKLDPGIIFCVFGFFAGIICLRIAIALYKDVIGLETRLQKTGLLIFCWGGGLLSLTGLTYNLILEDKTIYDSIKHMFILDPFEGWWFLNLGRNLIFPTEAYYHALFLAVVYGVYKKNYKLIVILTCLLAISHPFTGVIILMTLSVWVLLELFIIKNRNFPLLFPFWLIAIIFLQAILFFIIPSYSREHKILVQQWTLDWTISAKNFIPTYFLVGVLAIFPFISKSSIKNFLSSDFNRFLLVWLVINILLENHELFVKPHQPLHFTRGYVWIALFLMGAPLLINRLNRFLVNNNNPIIFTFLSIFLVLVFLFDNLSWFTIKSYSQLKGKSGLFLYNDQEDIFQYLSKNYESGYLILSQDENIGYLGTIYTPYRSFVSHKGNTPEEKDKTIIKNKFFNDYLFDETLKKRKLLVISRVNEFDVDLFNHENNVSLTSVYSNDSFNVLNYNN